MTICLSRFILIQILFLVSQSVIHAQEFSFASSNKNLRILYSKEGPKLDSIAAHLFAEDIKMVTGNQPKVITDITQATGNVIVLGTIASKLIQKFINKQSSLYQKLQGKWECFGFKIVTNPTRGISKVLVIAGSDARGTAYGVVTLSEKLGVSPWYWWADVPVKQQKNFTLNQKEYVSPSPSVKYRGIFINDEDWGLQPWAAKTFEPETGDIGPKTYAKVFELLLRLKANLVWPAMHPSTKAFFHYPLNKKVAEEYAIIIGSSHAEPMLRNNVGEWDEKTMGHFNYITNKEKVYQYWQSRAKEVGTQEVMFTLGMRGVHDSGMEGVKTTEEAVPLLEQIFNDQRDLLEKNQQKNIGSIPQVFTAYKEVLDIYDSGLKLPDDVTLVWPDDNYGYIQRLNNQKERLRSGGSGVYYHSSYWGRPHDYLWLSSTHPSLIREEMMKAYENGTNRLWVLNVGDIKPLEYNIQFFMDMAFDVNPFNKSSHAKQHLQQWIEKVFGKKNANAITAVLSGYYDLAFERRPEFMGWSQTEPTTKTTYTAYNHFYYGDEAQKRIDKYEALEKEVKTLWKQIDSIYSPAFYQLVYYPVICASLINKKFLYRDKSYAYAKQNRLSAFDYALWSKQAYDSIVKETNYFNDQMAGGKWKNIMSMKPRDLPVFEAPDTAQIIIKRSGKWNIAPEGFVTNDSSLVSNTHSLLLPRFDALNRQKYFIDIFLTDEEAMNWKASVSNNWIRLSAYSGILRNEEGKKQIRIWVDVDWSKISNAASQTGNISFAGEGHQVMVDVNVSATSPKELAGYRGFIENNGYVSMYAADFTRKSETKVRWEVIQNLGYAGKVMQVQTSAAREDTIPDLIKRNNAYLEYNFYTLSSAEPIIHIFSLPTHPLNNNFSMRYAVSIDNGQPQLINFRTYGRSEEWKQNVLRNRAEREIKMPHLTAGKHTLKIYCVDPGVILDEIRIDLGGLKPAYGIIAETKIAN